MAWSVPTYLNSYVGLKPRVRGLYRMQVMGLSGASQCIFPASFHL